MYLAPACTAWLALGVAIVEWRAMVEAGAFQIMRDNAGGFVLAAMMGFGVNSLAYVVIQSASSLTLKVGTGVGVRRGVQGGWPASHRPPCLPWS